MRAYVYTFVLGLASPPGPSCFVYITLKDGMGGEGVEMILKRKGESARQRLGLRLNSEKPMDSWTQKHFGGHKPVVQLLDLLC